jgi:hypothetical protein
VVHLLEQDGSGLVIAASQHQFRTHLSDPQKPPSVWASRGPADPRFKRTPRFKLEQTGWLSIVKARRSTIV